MVHYVSHSERSPERLHTIVESGADSLKQFRNHGPVIHGNHWAAGMIQKVLRRIHTEDMENRVVNVAGTERMFFGGFAESIGGPDQTTALDAAACHKARHGVAPVIAAGSAFAERGTAVAAVVHSWRAAEFSAQHHENSIQYAAI
jgi:hypothetical protein